MELDNAALIVVDVQRAFDEAVWGPRNNPACEANVAALIAAWRARSLPLVFVRHDSLMPGSPLARGTPGNEMKDVVTGTPDVLVTKHVNSAFIGEPDLDAWLRARGIERVYLCGIQTNFCVETTARMAANLGYDTHLVLDATHTFDQKALDGSTISADDLARVTASTFQTEFGHVVATADVVASALATHAG